MQTYVAGSLSDKSMSEMVQLAKEVYKYYVANEEGKIRKELQQWALESEKVGLGAVHKVCEEGC